VNIRFSRHAKRRMKLYSIEEDDVVSIVTNNMHECELEKRFVIIDHSMNQYELPIKIIGVKEEESIIIVTVYPLKTMIGGLKK
jgi:hypothetical protein